jgi:ABC-type multidrug transport system ATPase subunit
VSVGSVVLRADSIGKSYGARKVLSGVYFQAAAGEVTALLGRNGAGKSTLLKIAAGWVRADHGFVEFLGRRHLRPRAAALAREGLFLLPVDRSPLVPRSTLAQHLDALEARFGRGEATARAGVLERLGIAHLEHAPTAALSGGERRRAELALALLRRPRCLLADEPFRGIDPHDAEVVQGALTALAGEGCAVVLTGHEMTWMLGVGDVFVWVRDGSAEPLGRRADAERHWRFRREYLGA